LQKLFGGKILRPKRIFNVANLSHIQEVEGQKPLREIVDGEFGHCGFLKLSFIFLVAKRSTRRNVEKSAAGFRKTGPTALALISFSRLYTKST
jgi:hypothetical protein